MPMLAAAISLPRMAARKVPTVPLRTRITTKQQMVRTTRHRRKNERSAEKLIGPTWGRGTSTPVWPPPIHLSGNRKLSAMMAKASVASAR